MTEKEFRKFVQIKLVEANLSQYANKITSVICDVYEKGFKDGFDIGTKIK